MSEVVSDNFEPSDASDLAAACAGEHAAFARLYERHAPVVLSLCRRLGAGCGSGDQAAAEDSLQETFIRAFRKLHDVHDATHLRRWLYAIARRVCAEGRRAGHRRAVHEGAAMNAAALMLDGLATPDAFAAAAAGEELDQLGRALDQLDDRERLAIHLYYLESDPVAAASAALNCSRSAYYKLLAQARARLSALVREVQPS